ncbi:hypothetical protein [Marinobacter sp. SS21]|uniref:hypothetical protein n=1 Tax=Marinobacter sp. SS21 TaxID=2979460 RepID=UPI00232D2B59|nr:hypothetical protein [Marinobacter sp. SS21]MDC0661283.1 hypothetical protein [Marinobacter sp. SS21]
MKPINGVIRWLISGSCALLMAASMVAHAQDDLDVTMRMVTDDEALGNSFVQELQLPEPVPSLETGDLDSVPSNVELMREAGREVTETLAEQGRESRDALSTELPGELLDLLPLPEGPDQDGPVLDLPGLEDPDLPLVDEDKLLDTTDKLLDGAGQVLNP